MLPLERRVALNGVELALFEWPGTAPAVVFAHATGFHARLWDQVIAQLPGQHCLAVDMRGHGRSSQVGLFQNWLPFGQDLAALGQQLGLQNALGVGHSMGGYALALAASLLPGLFARLLLIDPVIMPRELYGTQPPEHFAARRRNHWASPAEFEARLQDRPPFTRWAPGVLRDYCQYGLRAAPDGHGFVLACLPAVEASIYVASTAASIYERLGRIQIPVTIIRLGPPRQADSWDMQASPTAPDLAAAFPAGVDHWLAQYSHFLPMEDPAYTAELIRAQLALLPREQR